MTKCGRVSFFILWAFLAIAATVLLFLNVKWHQLTVGWVVAAVVILIVVSILSIGVMESLTISIFTVFFGGKPKTEKEGDCSNLTLVLNYNMLAMDQHDVDDCFQRMYESYMNNLSENISAVYVSATKDDELMKYELSVRDKYRAKIYKTLVEEGRAYIEKRHEDLDYSRQINVWRRIEEKHGIVHMDESLNTMAQKYSKEFMCIQRVSKVLKKCGQYQDLMILSDGRFMSFTYSDTAFYGKYARSNGEPMFHDSDDVRNIHARNFDYTFVLDGDSRVPTGVAQTLLRIAAWKPEKAILQPAIKFEAGIWDTIYMNLEDLRQRLGEPVTNALAKVFDQCGFFGKALIKNRLYIDNVIGTPGEPLEKVPVNVLSHDTYEAAILKPYYIGSVSIIERPTYNYLAWNSRQRRWNLGDLIVAMYLFPRLIGAPIRVLQKCFQGKKYFRFQVRTKIKLDFVTAYIAYSSLRSMFTKPLWLILVIAMGFLPLPMYYPLMPIFVVLAIIVVIAKLCLFLRCQKALIYIIPELLSSILQYTVEIVAGPIRFIRVLWALIRGKYDWIPQKHVEEEFDTVNPCRIMWYSYFHLWGYALLAILIVVALFLCIFYFGILALLFTVPWILIYFDLACIFLLPLYCFVTSLRICPCCRCGKKKDEESDAGSDLVSMPSSSDLDVSNSVGPSGEKDRLITFPMARSLKQSPRFVPDDEKIHYKKSKKGMSLISSPETVIDINIDEGSQRHKQHGIGSIDSNKFWKFGRGSSRKKGVAHFDVDMQEFAMSERHHNPSAVIDLKGDRDVKLGNGHLGLNNSTKEIYTYTSESEGIPVRIEKVYDNREYHTDHGGTMYLPTSEPLGSSDQIYEYNSYVSNGGTVRPTNMPMPPAYVSNQVYMDVKPAKHKSVTIRSNPIEIPQHYQDDRNIYEPIGKHKATITIQGAKAGESSSDIYNMLVDVAADEEQRLETMAPHISKTSSLREIHTLRSSRKPRSSMKQLSEHTTVVLDDQASSLGSASMYDAYTAPDEVEVSFRALNSHDDFMQRRNRFEPHLREATNTYDPGYEGVHIQKSKNKKVFKEARKLQASSKPRHASSNFYDHMHGIVQSNRPYSDSGLQGTIVSYNPIGNEGMQEHEKWHKSEIIRKTRPSEGNERMYKITFNPSRSGTASTRVTSGKMREVLKKSNGSVRSVDNEKRIISGIEINRMINLDIGPARTLHRKVMLKSPYKKVQSMGVNSDTVDSETGVTVTSHNDTDFRSKSFNHADLNYGRPNIDLHITGLENTGLNLGNFSSSGATQNSFQHSRSYTGGSVLGSAIGSNVGNGNVSGSIVEKSVNNVTRLHTQGGTSGTSFSPSFSPNLNGITSSSNVSSSALATRVQVDPSSRVTRTTQSTTKSKGLLELDDDFEYRLANLGISSKRTASSTNARSTLGTGLGSSTTTTTRTTKYKTGSLPQDSILLDDFQKDAKPIVQRKETNLKQIVKNIHRK